MVAPPLRVRPDAPANPLAKLIVWPLKSVLPSSDSSARAQRRDKRPSRPCRVRACAVNGRTSGRKRRERSECSVIGVSSLAGRPTRRLWVESVEAGVMRTGHWWYVSSDCIFSSKTSSRARRLCASTLSGPRANRLAALPCRPRVRYPGRGGRRWVGSGRRARSPPQPSGLLGGAVFRFIPQ